AWLVTYPIAGWVATNAGFTATWTVLAGLAAIGAVTALAVWRRDEKVEAGERTVAAVQPRTGKVEAGGRAAIGVASGGTAVAAREAAKAAEGTLAAGQCACVRTV
ncbi:hypothetical protein BS330_43590, partial [Amycolatopsis keratiniphila subsp. nogabecina]